MDALGAGAQAIGDKPMPLDVSQHEISKAALVKPNDFAGQRAFTLCRKAASVQNDCLRLPRWAWHRTAIVHEDIGFGRGSADRLDDRSQALIEEREQAAATQRA